MDLQKQAIWKKAIHDCKLLIMDGSKAKIEIGKRAYDACDIIQGGGGHWSNHKNQYTMSHFARDIGMNRRTLSSYVYVYIYVYKFLPKVYQDDFNWTAAYKVLKFHKPQELSPIEVEVKYLYTLHQRPGTSPSSLFIKYLKTLDYEIQKLDFKNLAKAKDELQKLMDKIDEKLKN